ncbi:RNA-binding protein sym-2-like [Argiope bruennichi]|uniref:Heterogeneous nuclear ribonucleoprotein F like protein n=1 Tax=Argiope bruennichi TaxID=94029 RepID=A0A8T0EGX2_ARGBR|nr:RNA-binding protein sym-2-like [Argiope bruennichi]KAF8770954.1 Heterogeneous nuclear ribonucleoprotein F like protein [Argiope bruennichi]
MFTTNLRSILKVCSRFSTHTSLGVSRISPLINRNACLVRTFCDKPSHIVQMRGLEYETKEKDIIEFFKPLGITPKSVHLKCDGSGRVSGLCEVTFATHAEAVVAMRKKNAFMGNRFIRLTLKSFDIEGEKQKSGSIDDNQPSQNVINDLNIASNVQATYPLGHTVKMKNAPRRITDLAIYEFFWPVGSFPVSVKALYNESGIRTGEFEVQFLSHNDAVRAMTKNNTYLRNNFVELSLQK